MLRHPVLERLPFFLHPIRVLLKPPPGLGFNPSYRSINLHTERGFNPRTLSNIRIKHHSRTQVFCFRGFERRLGRSQLRLGCCSSTRGNRIHPRQSSSRYRSSCCYLRCGRGPDNVRLAQVIIRHRGLHRRMIHHSYGCQRIHLGLRRR